MKIKLLSKVYNITKEEVKQHLRIPTEFLDDDLYLEELIATATQFVENKIHNEISLNIYEATFKEFESDKLTIQKGNYNSLVSATIDGVALDISTIEVEDKEFKFTITFPSIQKGKLVINFKTGFESLEFLLNLKRAIIIKAGDLYDNERGSYNLTAIKENPQLINNLINDYKKLTFL